MGQGTARIGIELEAMRICYVLLSPTFGMHQYTADLANRFAGSYDGDVAAPTKVTVITPFSTPRDRYAPRVAVQSLVKIEGTGLKRSNLSLLGLRRVYRAVSAARPDVVHFTGPHVWNPILLQLLRRAGIPTVHTIHDLDPHSGTGYGGLLHMWNGLILRWADRILVHGQLYHNRLLRRGFTPERVEYVPLLHLCLGYESEAALRQTPPDPRYEPFVLFFARVEAYKGVDVLIEAMRQLQETTSFQAVIAGRGNLDDVVHGELPGNVDLRLRQIVDAEAIDLFGRCGVVVLPYRDATQSAIVPTAYFFGKPVIVTHTGALPEYVVDTRTGWIVDPGNAAQLADALNSALSQPGSLRRAGSAGREWYQAQRRQESKTLRTLYEGLSH